MTGPEVLGKDGTAKVAGTGACSGWQEQAAGRKAHKRRHTHRGATAETRRAAGHVRACAPLPRPGDRAHVDDATRDKEAKRVVRMEAAEHLQVCNWRWYGPRKDPVTGLWPQRHRIGSCGRPLGRAVSLTVAAIDDTGRPLTTGTDPSGAARRAQFNGVETCGNANACLRCGAKIRRRRAVDIGRVLRAHLAGGGHAVFLTFTFSHAAHEEAGQVIDDAMTAWTKMLQARRWRRMKTTMGVVGFIRTTEITHSDANGWHPHHHVALLTSQPLTHDDYDGGTLEAFRAELDHLWANQVVKLDRQVHPEIGVTAVPVRDDQGIGAYVSKIELELVRSDLKTGRRQGSRSHWQIGVNAAQARDGRDIALWHGFVKATALDRSHRYFSTSNGFWKQFGIKERTDEEIAAEQLEATPLVDIDRHIYAMAAKADRAVLTEIRGLAESGAGPELLATVLSRCLGIDLEVVDGKDGDLPVIGLRAARTGPADRSDLERR